MPVEAVGIPEVPSPATHFSLAVRAPAGGELLFVSGLSASDGAGGVVGEGDAAAQTREIYRKLAAVLERAGAHTRDLARLDVFVRNAADQATITRERVALAWTTPPTSTMVVVSGFPDDRYLLEISAIAVVPTRSSTGPSDGTAVLHLSDQDEVGIAMRPLREGETVVTGDVTVRARADVPRFHKLALRDIAAGADVHKYGEVIGHATFAIAAGDHVHTHNLVGNRLDTTGEAR